MQFRPAADRNGGPSFFSFNVIDSGGTSNGGVNNSGFSIQINITPVNDAPMIATNTLSITEGATVVLSITNINTTDPDNTPAQLTYTASSISGGQFELVTSPGTTITTFTQAHINSGAVQFVHNGGESAPSYALTVSDGSLSNGPSTVTIVTFTGVNDTPVTTTNMLSLNASDTVVLSSAHVNAADPDNTPAQLTYTASSITGGQFELVAGPGVAISSFTQANINSGQIQFVHNGGDITPAYDLTVSDSSLSYGPSSASVTFYVVNDLPTISAVANQTIDEDTTLGPIAFTVGDAETAATAMIVTATSSDETRIPNGNIVLGGTGTNRTVTITLTVSDGALSSQTTFQIAVNAVNDAPTITVVPDQTIDEATTTGPLAFTLGDIDSSVNAITVIATSSDQGLIPDGNLVLSGTGANRTVTVTTIADQNGGLVTITITVSDGGLTTVGTFMVNVTPLYDLPVIAPLGFTVHENSPVGTVVGSVFATDINAGAGLTYAVDAGNTNGAFAIDVATGQITVSNPAALDFETTSLSLSHGSVNENSLVGTPVGLLSSTDVDAGDGALYSLVDDGGGACSPSIH